MARSPAPRTLLLLWLALLAIALMIVVGIRVRLLDMPLERDEGEYAYAGQLMLQGIPPYQLAYNMKFPGTYAAYALLMAIFGQTAAGVHAGLLLINALTTAFIFLVGRRLLGLAGGCAAASTYAVLAVSPSVQGFAGHATHFVVLPMLAGIWLLLYARERQSTLLAFASGTLFSAALLMKQPGAIFAVAAFVCLCWLGWREGGEQRKRFMPAVLFAGGVLLPFAVTCLLLWRAGVFEKFWFWTFQYAREYGSQTSLEVGFRNFVSGITYVVGSEALLWILAATGFAVCVASWKSNADKLLIALSVAAAIAVCPGLYFRPHYFILALPAVSLLVGAMASRATEMWARRSNPLPVVVLAVVAAALALPLLAHREFLFVLSPEAASRRVYDTNPFPESRRIAEFLKQNTASDDTIAVLGSEPQIYFYASRRSATGYIYTYGLVEPHQYARRMQEEMIREIEAARPKYIMFVSITASWLRREESEQLLFDWFNEYSSRELEPAGYVGIVSATETEYYLPYNGQSLTPTDNHLTIWERKL